METRNRLHKKLCYLHIELPVLEQWDFKVFDVASQDRVMKLETDVGTKCLQLKTSPPQKVFRLFLLTEHLAQQGFKRIPRFIRTKYGEPFIKTGRRYYWVTDWIIGRPVNFKDQNDVVKSARTLAEFHLAAKGFYLAGEELDLTPEWAAEILKKAAQIVDLKSQINSPTFLKESLRIMAERAVCAAKILTGSGYRQLKERQRMEQSFCHGALNREHLIMSNGEVYMTGLSHWMREIRLRDLAEFLFLTGRVNQWDVQLCQKIMENYDRIYPLLPVEINLLQGYLLFPFGYWELLKELAEKNAGREETIAMLESYLQQEEKKLKCLAIY